MKKDKPGFFYLKRILPGLNEAKLNEGVLNGLQIRAIIKDSNFKSTLNQKEKRAWNAFEAVSTDFLADEKYALYKKIIKELQILTILTGNIKCRKDNMTTASRGEGDVGRQCNLVG